MGNEWEGKIKIEEERAKVAILAGQPQLYMKLWPQKEDENDIQWLTPETEEEAAEVIKRFESGIGGESIIKDPRS